MDKEKSKEKDEIKREIERIEHLPALSIYDETKLNRLRRELKVLEVEE
jgi:hypothetical protein